MYFKSLFEMFDEGMYDEDDVKEDIKFHIFNLLGDLLHTYDEPFFTRVTNRMLESIDLVKFKNYSSIQLKRKILEYVLTDGTQLIRISARVYAPVSKLVSSALDSHPELDFDHKLDFEFDFDHAPRAPRAPEKKKL